MDQSTHLLTLKLDSKIAVSKVVQRSHNSNNRTRCQLQRISAFRSTGIVEGLYWRILWQSAEFIVIKDSEASADCHMIGGL